VEAKLFSCLTKKQPIVVVGLDIETIVLFFVQIGLKMNGVVLLMAF
jgi:hypothetical protein